MQILHYTVWNMRMQLTKQAEGVFINWSMQKDLVSLEVSHTFNTQVTQLHQSFWRNVN